MKKLFKIVAILFLLFNGINALVGGFLMMSDPTGGKMQLPLSYLDHSPFQNFFIPGLVLFIANGLLSVAVLVAVFLRFRLYPQWIMLQGSVLLGWIVIQVIMVQHVFFLHYLMGGIGLLLIIVGLMLTFEQKKVA